MIKSILYDSGAQLSLVGNKFLLELVARGVFASLAAAVEQLCCSNVQVLVHGVSDGDSGSGLPSTKYMPLDLAITLDGSSAACASTRLTVEGVHAFYHPDFPTLLGDDVLLVTELTPEHHIAPFVGKSFRALQPFSRAAPNRMHPRSTNLAALSDAIPTLDEPPSDTFPPARWATRTSELPGWFHRRPPSTSHCPSGSTRA